MEILRSKGSSSTSAVLQYMDPGVIASIYQVSVFFSTVEYPCNSDLIFIFQGVWHSFV